MDNRDFAAIIIVLFLMTANVWIIYRELDEQHEAYVKLSGRVSDLEGVKKSTADETEKAA